MGQHSPALAAGLAATAALLGLQLGAPHPPQDAEPERASSVGPAAVVLAAAPVKARPAVANPKVRKVVAARSKGRPCSAGLIALTFDDGPSPTVTPKLVRMLVALKVPATFFMIGSRVDAHPQIARLVQDSGFELANHSWSHPQLTHLSNPAVRNQLRATTAAFKRHYLSPSRLMRPPYGDINGRVRGVVRELGLIPVLWSNDSLDWSGGDSVRIAHRILSALQPHGTNLVLQHDGVDNSPASLAAVPIVVRKARERGFCFTHLGRAGGVGGKVVTAQVRTQEARRHARRESARQVATASGPLGMQLRTSRKNGFRVLFGSKSGLVVPRSAYLDELIRSVTRR